MSSTTEQTGLISDLVPGFLLYIEVELHFARESLIKYKDCMRQVQRILGDQPVIEIDKTRILQLKENMLRRDLSVARQVSILLVLKRFLKYCAEEEGLLVYPSESIIMPRRPRKEVGFLTTEEVGRFLATIRLRTGDGHVYLPGLRLRALVEVLLGSAMRISEVLSLNRTTIDFSAQEAKIVGKGSKERVVFFTDRALYWLRQYLDCRHDDNPALFATTDGLRRLSRTDIWRPFGRHRKLAGIEKRLTPHMLRHTAATQLLFNGCPVGHIKEILGHERLETTCRYYLGLDHRAAKEAHQRYAIWLKTTSSVQQAGSPQVKSHEDIR